MEHPSRAISAFIVIAATPVALTLIFQLRGMLKKSELRREYPLPPLTRAKNPIVYWGLIGIGVLGTVITICGIAIALRWLLAP